MFPEFVYERIVFTLFSGSTQKFIIDVGDSSCLKIILFDVLNLLRYINELADPPATSSAC